MKVIWRRAGPCKLHRWRTRPAVVYTAMQNRRVCIIFSQKIARKKKKKRNEKNQKAEHEDMRTKAHRDEKKQERHRRDEIQYKYTNDRARAEDDDHAPWRIYAGNPPDSFRRR